MNPTKTFFTPNGAETRKLTDVEMNGAFASDTEVLKIKAKAAVAAAATDTEKLNAIMKYLGLDNPAAVEQGPTIMPNPEDGQSKRFKAYTKTELFALTEEEQVALLIAAGESTIPELERDRIALLLAITAGRLI